MEVTVVSTELIKPALHSTKHLKPHKICLFDQLTPMTYIVGVLFYPNSDPNFDTAKALNRARTSLSELLAIYYPFSGRNDGSNLYVVDFDAGVPFVEARVNCRMSEYLKHKDVDSVNKLVPYAPFRLETADPKSIPLLAVQLSVFTCGSITVGASSCHKNADGTTSCYVINGWAEICRGFPEKVVKPNFTDAAEAYPPFVDGLPEKYSAMMDRLWFTEASFVTRRFAFSAGAIEALRAKARSERVPRPSRNDVVSCFIWKHATEASWAVSGKPRMSFAGPAVNIRPRMTSPTAANAIGNLFWWGMAVMHPNTVEDEDGGESVSQNGPELNEMVGQMKEAMEGFDKDVLKDVKEGREGSSEIINQLEVMLTIEEEDPFIIGFTNWRGFFNDVDFGWGRPCWVGAIGKVGPAFRNLVILVETHSGNGIDAFIALDAKDMAVLENDPKFLAFASPNPGVSSL